MKTNNKNKKIVLSSLSAITLASMVVAPIVYQNSNLNTNSVVDSQVVNASTNIKSNTRTLTDNSNVSDLKNPDEVFFISKDWTQEDPWDSSKNELKSDGETNWQKYQNNFNAIKESHPEKSKLTQTFESMTKYIDYRKAEQQFMGQAASQELKDLWPIVKDTILQNKGGIGEFSQVPNLTSLDELKKIFLKMSGIAEGTKISKISNPAKYKMWDIATNNSSQDVTRNLNNFFGQEFQNLIKIAEINTNIEQNVVIDFNYNKNSSIAVATGKLVIRNDQKQLNNGISSANSNLDIFGRWTNLGSSSLGSLSWDKKLKNIIFSFDDSSKMLNVFVRTNANEIISNVSVSEGKVDKFGILDVQLDENNTFKSKIENIETSSANNLKLWQESDNKNIKEVEFFSDKLNVTKSIQKNERYDRKIDFYQLSDEKGYDFGVNFITSNTNNLASYKPLNIFTNGQDTGTQYKINVKYDGSVPSEFENPTYQFYSLLKDELPNDVEVPSDITKIELTSKLSNDKKIANQTLLFSDDFYGLGNRPSWIDVDINQHQYSIVLNNITDKIFSTKPELYQDSANTKTSTLNAVEQIDERSTVKKLFMDLYVSWSKNDTQYLTKTFNFTTSVVSFKKQGSQYKNIGFSDKNYKNINGYNLYVELNKYWNEVAAIINQIFSNTQILSNRYKIDGTNSTTSIFDQWLLGSPYIVDKNQVESVILQALELMKTESINNSNDVNLGNLKAETIVKLNELLKDLIKIQFEAIRNEFESKINSVLYNKFADVLSSSNSTTKQRKVAKSANEILDTTQSSTSRNATTLFKYKDGLKLNEMYTTQNATISDAVKSLLSILQYKSGNQMLSDGLFFIDNVNENFKNSNIDGLVNLNKNASFEEKESVMGIYRTLLEYFGYNVQNIVNSTLETGKYDPNSSVEFGGKTLEQVFDEIISKVIGNEKSLTFRLFTGNSVKSYVLDDLISGANAKNALNNKLSNLDNSIPQYNELRTKIVEILSQQQSNGGELSAWSNIIMGNKVYDNYTQQFSGRQGTKKLLDIYNSVVKNENILAKRSEEFSSAMLNQLTDSLKYVWITVVALIGVGVLVSSSIGLVNNNKQKMVSHPIIKWLLVAGVILGIAILVLGILLGIPLFL